MSLPRSNRGELHTAFTQSSIVPISRPLVELFAADGGNPCGEDAGDEHPANMAMATMAANPSTLFICTAPRVRWAACGTSSSHSVLGMTPVPRPSE
jgi:hypothetical protein